MGTLAFIAAMLAVPVIVSAVIVMAILAVASHFDGDTGSEDPHV